MNLYFINASDDNGDSMDLFVRAYTPQEALDIWKVHDVGFGWATCFEANLSSEPAGHADENDLRIFQVPDSNAIGAINWHASNGINVVAHVNPI